MSLFIDNDVLTVADLTGIESEVSSAAEDASISVDGDNGIILQAWQEVANKITENVQSFDGGITYWPDAVLTANTGMNRPRVRLNQIVASSLQYRRKSALQTYMTYYALMMFYRAASARLEVDRYEEKFQRYEKEAKEAWRTLHGSGLPIVWAPLPCPGATHEWLAGVFDENCLTAVAGGSGSGAAQYQVAITWVDKTTYQGPTSNGNAESGPSAVAGITLAAAQKITVSIAGLLPPSPTNYSLGTSDGVYTCKTATGWNVYEGVPGGPMFLQNASPLPLTTTSYTFDPAGVAQPYTMGFGQYPDISLTMQKMIRRG